MMKFGKVLVFVNLAFSFLFVAWAWALYKNSVQYYFVSDEMPGKIKELQDRINRLVLQRDAAENRWQAAHVAIVQAEDLRYKNQDWYTELRKILEEGTDSQGNPSKVLPLEVGNNGMLVKQGLKPIMIGKEVADGLRVYEDRYKKADDALKQEIAAINKLIEDQKRLTDEINGIPGKTIGLRTLLAQEELALKQSKEEQERLTPSLYNSQAEAELLIKRNLALKARLKELGGVVAAEPR